MLKKSGKHGSQNTKAKRLLLTQEKNDNNIEITIPVRLSAKNGLKQNSFTNVRNSMLVHNINERRIRMSIDNMILASHALSIYKNGRKLNLNDYPEQVKRYVSRTIKAGNVDGDLKKLNKQLVCRIGDE